MTNARYRRKQLAKRDGSLAPVPSVEAAAPAPRAPDATPAPEPSPAPSAERERAPD